MRRLAFPKPLRLSPAAIAALVASVFVVAGALVWFLPYLTQKRAFVADVAAPPPLFTLSEISVPARGQACLSDVTVEPNARQAQFTVRPGVTSPTGGPPFQLILQAPGYRSVTRLAGGYPGGAANLPISAPTRAVIGTACFANQGRIPLALSGSMEARTISRSKLTVDQKPVPGDVTLSFIDGRDRSLLDDLGTVFARASRLTDGLVPTWCVWALALAIVLGLPAGAIAAFYVALRESAV